MYNKYHVMHHKILYKTTFLELGKLDIFVQKKDAYTRYTFKDAEKTSMQINENFCLSPKILDAKIFSTDATLKFFVCMYYIKPFR